MLCSRRAAVVRGAIQNRLESLGQPANGGFVKQRTVVYHVHVDDFAGGLGQNPEVRHRLRRGRFQFGINLLGYSQVPGAVPAASQTLILKRESNIEKGIPLETPFYP